MEFHFGIKPQYKFHVQFHKIKLYSEVNELIQHIIVQDQDGQNNNIHKILRKWF